jgi:cytosine/adenosine deaminase-related metal-dependent hydrolase
LIRGKFLIAKALGSERVALIENGGLVERDGVIVAVGDADELLARFAVDRTLGSLDHVVLPGFVNAHHHVGLTSLQMGVNDAPLELWFAQRVLASRDVDPYLDTLYSAMEMIASGVTTAQHLHSWRRGSYAAWMPSAERILSAYRDVGMRVSYSLAVRDQNWIVCGDDAGFLAGLPPDIASPLAGLLADVETPLDEYFAFFDALYRTHDRGNDGRTRIQLAPGNLHWCSDRSLERQAECAERYGVGMHMHLLETPYQDVYARRRFGRSAVRHLDALGLLGPHMTLGHAAWVDDLDVDVIAERGAMVCHNASSNLRLQGGIAPLGRFLESGVRVALGIDESTISDDRDILLEMRLVRNLHRTPGIGARVPSCDEVFQMATEHGALTTAFGDTIGTLEPGRLADCVLMRLSPIVEPYLDPATPFLDALLHRARPAHIESVVIGGELVYHEGRFTRIDRESVLAELQEQLRAPLSAREEAGRELSRRLLPFIRSYYTGWLDDEVRASPSARMTDRRNRGT